LLDYCLTTVRLHVDEFYKGKLMSKVGQKERITQNRIVQFFQTELEYSYLGDWQDRENNKNIEVAILTK
jgi:hypothetical protein